MSETQLDKPTNDVLPPNESEIEALLRELSAIRADMLSFETSKSALLEQIHDNYRQSARNLLHYLALRSRDLRPLQLRLAALGFSSLGRAESHVMATIDAVLQALRGQAGSLAMAPPAASGAGRDHGHVDFRRGQRLLAEHTEALFGAARPGRQVRIMVTMPSAAAQDYRLVHDLLLQGMDCMRINCAHDDPATWSRMIEYLRRAEQALSRPCKLLMDLAGPKLRTGAIEAGPAVLRIRPQRDIYGRVTAPAQVWLTAQQSPRAAPAGADGVLPLPGEWIRQLRKHEELQFHDARRSKRRMRITAVLDDGAWAELEKTAYVMPGTLLRHAPAVAKGDAREAAVGALPKREAALPLQIGDHLILGRDVALGRPAVCDRGGRMLMPATIGCSIPEVIGDVRAGDPIWFDDGKIGGVVEQVDQDHACICITHTPPGGARLKADKGINLPETPIRLGALTAKDLEDLAFVGRHADIVGLSFANSAEDVERLQQLLHEHQPAIMLKVETQRGFQNLPQMLLRAMRWPCCGVMIARGDLAVECGFERLAEVQEEILWISEAAHVPVTWATQVLESLAKTGMPSRAEISDAAMGHRAECVMLNKGPHVIGAVQALGDILQRMQAHQAKKHSMLRELHLAHALAVEPART